MMKIKQEQFFSSVYYAAGILIFPVFYILNTILFACFAPVAWWWVPIFFLAQFWIGKFAFVWYKRLKCFLSQICYRNFARKNSAQLQQIQQLRKRITDIVLSKE